MNRHKRRKLPHARAEGALPADIAAPLLDQAAAWIDDLRMRGQTHLFYPVSRMQRKFRIGYRATCVLADMLAQRGEWMVRFSGDGTRYARIHPRMSA
jgi:DNA segregation ATPase FtsK/SpoIIIE-like protein